MFDVPLTNLLQTDQQRVPGAQIPLIVEEVCALFVSYGTLELAFLIARFVFPFNWGLP